MLENQLKLSTLCPVLVGTMWMNMALAGDSGIYLGLDGGRAEADKFCNNITNCKSADTSWSGDVGFQFNKILGAELGYTSFGTVFKANNLNINAKEEANAITASVLGTWQIVGPFGVFGRVGVARYDASNSGTVQGVPVDSKNAVRPYFGAGVKFDLTSSWMLRAEYQLFTDISGVQGSKADVQGLYAGVVYRF